MYFLYIILCRDQSLYTGITTNLARRLQEHKSGTASHYTSAKGVVKMVYSEKHKNRSEALKREAEIKSWSRQKKLNLIGRRALFDHTMRDWSDPANDDLFDLTKKK